MSSNMLAGDRRWATARRGGMTVLGKVAVPKPLNLPSQRLENHGLDPTVEIVPKGTLSWGSRPSSSGSNAWVSSSLSPTADGANTSPGHLSGRPSSGGSGTRPSTAGSDRAHEPLSSAWSSNSRPSSASGTLGSNQSSSISLRPKSAETRPNSSQLSRFAEPVSENSVAWGPSSTAERLGVKSSKEDGFSLSSGDFPTLGSEKENPVKNFEPQDHGRPSSASGRITPSKEKNIISRADAEHGMVNEWRNDSSPFPGAGNHPSMEKWQGEPQQYFNSNVAPQHFDAWRGPPVNHPADVWYRGQPRGPPFGAPVAPGGFPMEPFPYYRPQLPPPALAGSQSAPRGSVPRGPHPQMGELYGPQMPDAYAHPGVPFRPGFYPAPPGPMGYYGPPMGYGKNERDISHMGIRPGPTVYNVYPGSRGPDMVNSRGRAGPSGKTISEHMEAVYLEDTGGPKRLPQKGHNEWDQEEEGENWEHVQPNFSYAGKSCLPMITSRNNEWGAEDDAEEDIFAKRTIPSENSSRSSPRRDHSFGSVKMKSSEGIRNMKADDDNWTNKSESVPRFAQGMHQLPIARERNSSSVSATKDSALMQKVEGLNAKVRASELSNDELHSCKSEEQMSRSKVIDLRIKDDTAEGRDSAGSWEMIPVSGDFVPVPHEVFSPAGNKPIQPMAVLSRRGYHGAQGRVDQQLKGKYNNQDTDGWRKKPLLPDSSRTTTTSNIESVSSSQAPGPSSVGEATVISAINPVGSIEGESVAETSNSTATQAQRVKVRELAKQRALQLQKEEEERTREQKAKALAKLEELNRRTQAGEVANQKAERTQAIADKQGEQEKLCPVGEPVMGDLQSQAPSKNLVSKPGDAVVDKDSSSTEPGESVVTRNLSADIPKTVQLGPNSLHIHSLPTKEDSDTANSGKVTSQSDDVGISRHKRTGHKIQTSLLRKGSNVMSVSHSASAAQKDHPYVGATNVTLTEAPASELKPSGELNMQKTYNTVAEPSTDRRKKVVSKSKSKHRLDEALAAPTLPPEISSVNPEQESTENSESKSSLPNLGRGVSTVVEPDTGLHTQEAYASLPNEESQNRVINHGKPQPLRRTSRSQHASRFVDKVHGSDVIWAPVRTKNKAEDSVEASQRPTMESATPAKNDIVVQNTSKGKKAEIERYIPKPVAKELAQQGSVLPLQSSISSSKSDEAMEVGQLVSSQSPLPVSSASALVGSNVEIKEGDGKHKKHKKEHGQWRQRGTADSSHSKVMHLAPSPISEPTKVAQQPMEQNQSVKSEKDSANAEIRTSGNGDATGWYDIPNNTTVAGVNRSTAVKDQGAIGHGKRNMPRARSTGNNPDHKKIPTGETHGSFVQSEGTDNLSDRTVTSKENQSFVEQTSSHWQPKSHSSSTYSQHGKNIALSEPGNTEMSKHSAKGCPQRKVQVPPQHDKEGSNLGPLQPDQLVTKSNLSIESVVAHHQEFNREKKAAPTRGRPYSPNLDSAVSKDHAANADSEQECNMYSDSRRNGSQNRHTTRGHQSRGDWSSGQNNKPRNVPPFHERRKPNVHYEYQPVGYSKGGNPDKLEEPTDRGQRYRERGQNHPKRGGTSYRRQTGGARMDSGQD